MEWGVARRIFCPRSLQHGRIAKLRMSRLEIGSELFLKVILIGHFISDLTSKPGYWAKAVSEAYISKGTLIHYYVAGNGDVHFGANGHDLGMFFSGIDTRQPLWAMIDLYGNCTSLEMVDSRSSLNNFSLNSSSGSTRAPSRNCDGIIGSIHCSICHTFQNVKVERIFYEDPLPPSHSNQALHSPVHVILPNPQPVARLPSPPAPLTLPDGPGIPRPMRTSVSNASVNSVSFPPLKYNNGISFRTVRKKLFKFFKCFSLHFESQV